MARQLRLRLEYSGALYHVTARANEQHTIVHDEADRRHFLTLFGHEILPGLAVLGLLLGGQSLASPPRNAGTKSESRDAARERELYSALQLAASPCGASP